MTPDWGLLGSRLLVGLPLNVVLAVPAWRAGSVRPSGAVVGILVGAAIYAGLGWRGFIVFAGMFAIGTALTRHGYARKEAIGTAEERKGARGASHALANAGVAAVTALLGWLTADPIWGIAFTASLATASMDTAGSELGPLYGRRTVSLKTFRTVRPGTEGAISLEGTLGGIAAALVLAVLAWELDVVALKSVVAVVLGAIAGNLYEGIAGSRHLLPHAWLNATNTAVGAAAAVAVAALLG